MANPTYRGSIVANLPAVGKIKNHNHTTWLDIGPAHRKDGNSCSDTAVKPQYDQSHCHNSDLSKQVAMLV